jgi:hypothetical protein
MTPKRPRYRSMRAFLLGATAVLAAVSGIQPHAHALTDSATLGDLKFTVYAPDWTWQKRDINVLVVLENADSAAAQVTLSLRFPPGKEDHFEYGGEQSLSVAVPPGESVRHAFTDIRALDDVPRQVYDFTLSVIYGGREAQVVYPVRTIRGAAVSPGKWALLLPGGIALAWCIVFATVVRRFAEPGAWRIPSAPVPEPERGEPWMS